MKTFTAMSIVALMLLAIFAVPASAADTVEIRSSYLAGANFEAITADGPAVIDAGSFAGFYYDLDDDITTEDITILDGADTKGLTIGEGQLVYNTKIMPTKYAYDAWGSFGIEGFFAEDYVPLAAEFNAEGTATTDGTPDKLAKLILDSDDKYTVRTGEKLDLGAGYALEAKQVDVDGNKVWIEFTKDGEYVDDEVIDMDEDKNWFVELDDIEDEDDVEVLKVHVNQVFQGAEDSIAQIDGLWLIDYANAMTIERDF